MFFNNNKRKIENKDSKKIKKNHLEENPIEQNNIGNYYYNNNDYKESIFWFEKSANQGYVHGMISMAHCCYHGKGITKGKRNISFLKSNKIRYKSIITLVNFIIYINDNII
jgi:TPR repeat protein